ncbi:Ubiquinone biosynthesis protein COQ9, mitochondrial, partial [Eumeta japonica]
MPQNASTALAQVLTLVDDICYYSGDRSVDIEWYTRRIGLATILKMTELYMLQDDSANFCKTWEFLENRMEEAVQLQMVLQQTEGVKHKFQSSFNSAFITPEEKVQDISCKKKKKKKNKSLSKSLSLAQASSTGTVFMQTGISRAPNIEYGITPNVLRYTF